jgi:hypothetical protein
MMEKDQFIETKPGISTDEAPVTEVSTSEAPKAVEAQAFEATHAAGETKVSTLKEFAAFPANKTARGLILAAAICCYISAGVTVILGASSYPPMLLDAAILLGLGLWVHVSKTLASAVVLLVYAGINTLIMLAMTQSAGGWLILAGGILAVVGANMLNKDWKAYQAQ